MTRARATTLLAAACAAAALAGAQARPSEAAFSVTTPVAGNSIAVDALRNYFQVTPGTAVQAGTATKVAIGDVDTLALAFASVPSARTFTNVFTVQNLSSQARTATLALSGVSQISSVVFASSGTATVTLAAGASTSVTVTTSATVAGVGSGTLRLGLSGVSWLYRDYATSLDEAPEAPGGSVQATPRPAGRVDLSWSASTTTTGLTGYNVYRSSGGAFARLNASPLAGTTYADTATVDGTAYTYKIRAASATAESIDSATAAATADATAPGAPTAVVLANGGGAGSAYVNRGNRASISMTVTLPAGALATDSVTVTASDGTRTVSTTIPGRAGAGTVTANGIDVTTLSDGTVTLSATTADAAGNVSGAYSGSAPKDTVAPAAPVASYVDVNNGFDQITGTAEAGTTVTANETAPAASGPYTATAAGNGSYTVTVAKVNGKANPPTAVSYTVTATDAAGNVSAATTCTANDTR